MRSLILLALSFVMTGLNAHASGFCNLTPTVYVSSLPYENRNQSQELKKYPVTTWRECYQRAIKMAGERDFDQSANVCQSDGTNCLKMDGQLFVGWYFWSDESLVTLSGQVTRYTSEFDRNEIVRGDRRFFPDGSMFP